jgi:hypothetical protein
LTAVLVTRHIRSRRIPHDALSGWGGLWQGRGNGCRPDPAGGPDRIRLHRPARGSFAVSHCALTADEPWAPEFANIVEAWPPPADSPVQSASPQTGSDHRVRGITRRLCLPFARSHRCSPGRAKRRHGSSAEPRSRSARFGRRKPGPLRAVASSGPRALAVEQLGLRHGQIADRQVDCESRQVH